MDWRLLALSEGGEQGIHVPVEGAMKLAVQIVEVTRLPDFARLSG
jgi:hypothetical protein